MTLHALESRRINGGCQNCLKTAAFRSTIEFFGFRQAIEKPPPYFEGTGCKKAGSRETPITETQFTAYTFHEKKARNGRFWSKIEFFGLRQAFEDPPPPISRVLAAKKQVLGRHRSRKQSLQHAYAPKFAILHEKNGQEWLFFGQRLSFLASDKHSKTPPHHFEGAGCKRAGHKGTQTTKTQFAASVCTKTSHFS